MPSMSIRSLSRATVSTHRDASRLELLEYYLLHHEDLAGCARASLEWLNSYAGVKRSVCLAVDTEAGILIGIAGFGVPNEEVDLFAWPLSDTRDPLVATLSSPDPIVFKPGRVTGHVGRVTPARRSHRRRTRFLIRRSPLRKSGNARRTHHSGQTFSWPPKTLSLPRRRNGPTRGCHTPLVRSS